MLILNPSLMSSMSDEHLIAALHAEGNLMPTEIQLLARLEAATAGPSAEEVASELENAYEISMEQSEFRAQLIAEIIEMCDESPTKCKELVSRIKSAFENSYVEL